jgi:hypothetical protein
VKNSHTHISWQSFGLNCRPFPAELLTKKISPADNPATRKTSTASAAKSPAYDKEKFSKAPGCRRRIEKIDIACQTGSEADVER